MKMIRFLWMALLPIIGFNTLNGQDFIFSNGFESPLYLNPGFAGNAEYPTLTTHIKKPASIGGLFYYAASYDQPVDKLRGGIGFVLSSSIIEDIKTESLLNGIYALHLKVSDEVYIRPAINLGLGYNHISNGGLTGGGSGNDQVSKGYLNAGFGVLVGYRNVTAGLAVDHFNKPDIGYENAENRLPAKITLHGILQHEIQDNMFLFPGLIYQHHWGLNRFVPSLVADIMGFRVGVSVIRQSSATVGSTGFTGLVGVALNQFVLGYSYTAHAGDIVLIDLPAHEFAITYKFKGRN
ncbi:MAG: PorP/SprF family type IX secretion system membrane protein [Bacteroidales bacterium]